MAYMELCVNLPFDVQDIKLAACERIARSFDKALSLENLDKAIGKVESAEEIIKAKRTFQAAVSRLEDQLKLKFDPEYRLKIKQLFKQELEKQEPSFAM
jgi:UDP-galactopyranose mutase